ncbi:MAG: PEP/pyruvate-binding domain-containing protein [Anaerolineae bacterium]
MESYVLPLGQIEAEHAHLVGGKALHLGELYRAGVQVPAGFVVTTAAYRAFIEAHGLDRSLEEVLVTLDWDSPQLVEQVGPVQELIRQHSLPPDVADAIAAAHHEMGVPVAVRSSATSEDLPDASFAGQYDTYLNVLTLEDVIERVKACWASLWNAWALAYRHRHNLSPLEAAMGVVVQQQVPAEVSGVLFTLNPTTGLEEEMLVEASWGLGEAVVSGRVTPDRFVVDAWNEQVRSREVSDKGVMVVPDESPGVKEVPVSGDRRAQPALTDEQLLQLVQLGYQVQGIYGYPQDIEWALHQGVFYVLQARPLTAYTFTPEIGQWTSANFREVMPGFVTPLSFSTSLEHDWGRSLEEFFLKTKMMRERREVQWGRMFFGHAYWNVGEVKRLASIVPGFKERAFDESAGVEITYEGDGLVTPWTPRTILRALPCLFGLQNLFENFWKEADAYKREFLPEEAQCARIDPAALSDAELAEQVRYVFDLHYRTNRVALIVSFLTTQAQDDFSPMVEGLNRRNPDAEPISMARLLTGLTEVSTGRPIVELWRVSREAVKEPRVAQTILEAEPSELPQRLQVFPEGRAFWEVLARFIQEFRYMAENDEDFSLPRWDEDPTFVFTTLKGFIEGGEGADPEKLIAHQKEVRLREEERAAQLLSRGWLDRLIRKRRFFSQLELLKRYCWWREETRPMLSLAHYHCRRFALEQGKRWAARGYIEDPNDIFILTRDQVLAALDGELSSEEARAWVRKYRRMKLCYRNFEPPPTIGRGVRPRAPGVSPEVAVGRTFRGVACSAGRVTARAKVVRNLGQAPKLRKGEILVAPYTNPGWIPLFNLAAGIVTEEGGLISHGAIVAREYGIPTVLQVRGATKVFQDGQVLCVDGDRGIVELVEG